MKSKSLFLLSALTFSMVFSWTASAEDVQVEDIFEVEESTGGWQQAYLDAIESVNGSGVYGDFSYALIYVDGDSIPELLCNTGIEAGGCQVYTWHDGVLDQLQTSRLGYTYIESANLFNNTGGHMGYYFDNIYAIEDGMWVEVAAGYYVEENGTSSYTWENESVTEEEYNMMLNEAYDTNLAQTAEYYYTYDEIRSILLTGEESSAGHHYEVVRKDVTWSEAQEECEAKGGHLAVLTSQEEFNYVSDLIKEAGCQGCSIWVGGSSKYSTQFGYYWIAPEGEYNMINSSFLPFWLDGEPSYTGLTESGAEVEEDSVAMLYIKSEDRFYLNDAPDDILRAAPSYAGIIAYVCEYE
ncbi:MAG: C-type lectin domain-containing protein [Eubacteriales bacterium]|nr:C-type lectin domain-containing protein [Eubacteriales bacterium]